MVVFLKRFIDAYDEFIIDVVLQELVEGVPFKKVDQRLVQMSSELLLPLLFGFFALRMTDCVLVLTQNVKVVSSWGEQGKDETEGVCVGQNGR